MERRSFLAAAGSLALTATGAWFASRMAFASDSSTRKGSNMEKADSQGKFPYQLSEQEWKEKLGPMEYAVLRQEKTEPAFSSDLNDEKREGEYRCRGCNQLLFLSEHKFDSGTGWPSFSRPARENSIETRTDFKLIFPRTEVHCANCGGHQGHVFNDGPEPTGKRYCINGAALVFVPETGRD